MISPARFPSFTILDAAAPRHRVFNVSLERTYTRREIAAVAAGLVSGAVIDFGPGTWPHEDQQAALDLTRARAELGFAPAFTLESALAEYVAWLRTHDR